jgi:hypothetical protein
MPTLAGNISTTIEFVFDRIPTIQGWTLAILGWTFGLGHFSSSSPEIAEQSSQETAKKASLVASSKYFPN